MQIEHDGSKVLVLTAAQPVDTNLAALHKILLPGYWERLRGWGCQNLLLSKAIVYGILGRVWRSCACIVPLISLVAKGCGKLLVEGGKIYTFSPWSGVGAAFDLGQV